MRTGAPTDRRGYLHEAVLYDSDEEFLGHQRAHPRPLPGPVPTMDRTGPHRGHGH
jgi:hypothetical protein